jgi:hypothetical protein
MAWKTGGLMNLGWFVPADNLSDNVKKVTSLTSLPGLVNFSFR